LASAAEEILGKLVDYLTNTPTDKVKEGFALRTQILAEYEMSLIFDENAEEIDAIRKRIVFAKNYVKHYSRPSETKFNRTPRKEARELLLRAICNLNVLLDEPGKDIDHFEDMLQKEDEADIVAILHPTPASL